MRNYLGQRPPWLQLLIFGLITAVVTFVGSTLGLFIVAKFSHIDISTLSGLKQEDLAAAKFTAFNKGMLLVQFFAIFLIPSLLFSWLADPYPLAYAGLKKPLSKNAVLLGIVIIIFSSFLVIWLRVVNDGLIKLIAGSNVQQWMEKSEKAIDDTVQQILTMHNLGDLFISLMLVAVLPAIGEELFFRGMVQPLFIKLFKSPWFGILLTAAVFSAVHGQFYGFLPRWALGVVLGLLYYYSGSLYPAMAGHFVFNGAQVVLVYFYPKKASFDEPTNWSSSSLALTGVICLVAVTGLLYYLKMQSQAARNSIASTAVPVDNEIDERS